MSPAEEGWDGLIGQEAVRLQLTRTEPFAALLMAGPEGIGKSLLARWYAAWLNCAAPPPSPPWECSCLSCRKILKGNHPDVQTLRREADKLSLGVQEVRDFMGQLSMRRYEGRYRVSLIDEAERLTDEAQSALLKVLEEPPPNQLLILICSQEFRLLPTVRSRCRLYRCPPLPVAQVRAYLESRGLPPERSAMFARLAEGRLGYALRLAESENLWNLQEEAFDLLQGLAGASLWQALETARSLESLKVDDSGGSTFTAARGVAEFHLNLIQIWLRDLVMLSCPPTDAVAETLLEHRLSRLQELTPRFPLERLRHLMARVDESRLHLQANVNPRFVLQSLCLSLSGR